MVSQILNIHASYLQVLSGSFTHPVYDAFSSLYIVLRSGITCVSYYIRKRGVSTRLKACTEVGFVRHLQLFSMEVS